MEAQTSMLNANIVKCIYFPRVKYREIHVVPRVDYSEIHVLSWVCGSLVVANIGKRSHFLGLNAIKRRCFPRVESSAGVSLGLSQMQMFSPG